MISTNSKIDMMNIMPTESEIDEWFTTLSVNPPFCIMKDDAAIRGAIKYRAILIQRMQSENAKLRANLNLDDSEEAIIRESLLKHKGRRGKAARDLGISERTLYRKIKSLKL